MADDFADPLIAESPGSKQVVLDTFGDIDTVVAASADLEIDLIAD